MAESFGIVVSAGQGLAGVLSIIQEFRKAYIRQHDQTEFLDRYRLVLLSITEQVARIQKDETLATSDVLGTINRLKEPQERLSKWLKKVDRRSKRTNFMNQLVNGNTEREELNEIHRALSEVKSDLTTAIARAVHDTAKKIEKGVAENSEGIREIKSLLIDDPINQSGQRYDPKQRQPRHQRSRSADLSDSGISTNGSNDGPLSEDSGFENQPEFSNSNVWKVVTNNEATKESMMVNAPIGSVETWQDVSIRISDNRADNGSFMVNHANDPKNIAAMIELRAMWLGQKRS